MHAYILNVLIRRRNRSRKATTGRDALNNTSCECVVAKANEADCSANAEVQTREEGGSCIKSTQRSRKDKITHALRAYYRRRRYNRCETQRI